MHLPSSLGAALFASTALASPITKRSPQAESATKSFSVPLYHDNAQRSGVAQYARFHTKYARYATNTSPSSGNITGVSDATDYEAGLEWLANITRGTPPTVILDGLRHW